MTTKATVNERVHHIPDIWLAGYTRRGGTIEEAVRHWDDQARLEERYRREREKS